MKEQYTIIVNEDNLEQFTETNDEIITILTSNSRDTLDKALAERPGRIDVALEIERMETDEVIRLVDKKLASFEKTFATSAGFLKEKQYRMSGAYVAEAVIGAAREGITAGKITEEMLVKHLDMQQSMVKKKDRLGFLAS